MCLPSLVGYLFVCSLAGLRGKLGHWLCSGLVNLLFGLFAGWLVGWALVASA